jgi:hypothetical protein
MKKAKQEKESEEREREETGGTRVSSSAIKSLCPSSPTDIKAG